MNHGLYLDNSMYRMINEIDSKMQGSTQCLSCQMCDVVDTFRTLLFVAPVIIITLLFILIMCSLVMRVGEKGLIGSLALLFSQIVSVYIVVFFRGHLELMDLLVMACMPGIGIDYIVHIVFCADTEIKFVKNSILHCFMTTSLCFYGLIVSEFILIRYMATSFLISLFVTFMEATCFCYLIESRIERKLSSSNLLAK